MNRREFLETVSAAAVLPALSRQVAPVNEWGSAVFDLHFHLRQQPAGNIAHLDGAGLEVLQAARRIIAGEDHRAIAAE